MYKAIIFDFFEVMHHDPYHAVFKEQGMEQGGDAFDQLCQELDLGKINYASYMERLSDHLAMKPASLESRVKELARLVDGMPELVQELQANYKTALLSNAGEEELHRLLSRHGLWNYFDEIIVSASVGLRKPDPEIFKLMLDRLGIEPKDAIFVDDNSKNIAAANAVGITGLVFKDHLQLRTELSGLGLQLTAA